MIAQEVATAAELSVLYALGVRHLQSHWIAPAAAAVGTRGVPRVVSRTRLGSDRSALAMAGRGRMDFRASPVNKLAEWTMPISIR